ncbi:hypothetical protein Q3O60_12880 [Alkalimonas collagenimarina]|uniref:Transmembrane protein n=1 Tax=Alkalimonas collagenimarina TaxID=400390 RepID=A0ABT9H1A6_9GAMM|nr:hypothetical protein [Alkalimonas collagenimarina]MDP4537086.1 hypothetical protein [Alkalimonas collagenimarina]
MKIQFEAIQSSRQLIIHSSSYAFLLSSVLFLVFFLFFSFYMVVFAIRGKIATKKHKKFVIRCFFAPMGFAFVLAFVGHFAINSYYRQQMSANGYQRCSDTTLLLARVTYSAWVKDPVLCHDSDVRRIVRRGHWDESFKVEQMLQQRNHREEARLERLEREAERQEARRRQRETLATEQ